MSCTSNRRMRKGALRSVAATVSLSLMVTACASLKPPTTSVAAPSETALDAKALARFDLDHESLARLHTEAGLTSEEILRLSGAIVAKTLRKLDQPKADQPDEAMRWRYLQRLDENGQMPFNAIMIAKGQRDRLVDPSRVTSLVWEWLGPGNIGGRTRSIVINPLNPSIMYAGGVGGGVWKTTSAGATWTPLVDFLPSIAVASMAMDPNNPDTIFVGTGEGTFNGDAIKGAGIFVTNDAGVTFHQLASTANTQFEFVNRISFAPGSSTTLLAATNTGVYQSTDAGATFQLRISGRTLDIDFDPTNPLRAVAGRDGQVVRSADGGATWLAAAGIPTAGGRVEVAYAPSDTTIVYASVQNNGLYRSTDSGATFTLVNNVADYMGSQGWYDNIVWVDPVDANIVVVGGVDFWRSVNGGVTLTRISQWQFAPNSAHADQHMIVAHPGYNGGSNRTVYITDDGGIYRADDIRTAAGTNGWTELNNNYGVTQFYGGAGNTSGRLLGGTQDNGTLVYTGSTEGWFTMLGGDGTFSAADQVQTQFFYGAYQFGNLVRSSNFGTGIIVDIHFGITDVDSQITNFIPPFILDPNDQAKLIFGGASLWRTSNARLNPVQWSIIRPDSGSNHSAIAIADGDANILWVGLNNGDVYRSLDATNATPTWTRVDAATLPNRWVTRIVIDPANHNRVFVTFSGFAFNNVWRTLDGGATWVSVSGTGAGALPALPINSLALDAINPDRFFVGSDLGVLFTIDGGQSWTTTNVGPANTVVDEIFWWTDDLGMEWLVAATHGRGMFRAAVSLPCPADLNGDGAVGSGDLAILLGQWGSTSGVGDINGDGVTGSADLAVMLGVWGPCP